MIVQKKKIDPITMSMMCRDRVRKKKLHDKMVRDRLEQEEKMKKDRIVEDIARAEKKPQRLRSV